jgi:hypothetical protein
VDLGYSQNDCNSTACKWTKQNSGSFGLQIRMPYAPEWNHVEPVNVQACRNKGPGGGVTPNGQPQTESANDRVSDALKESMTFTSLNPFQDPLNPTNTPAQTGQSVPTSQPSTPIPSIAPSGSGGSGGSGTPYPTTGSYTPSPVTNSYVSPLSPAPVSPNIPFTPIPFYTYQTIGINSSTTGISDSTLTDFERLSLIAETNIPVPSTRTASAPLTTPAPAKLNDEIYDIGNTGVSVNTGGSNLYDHAPAEVYAVAGTADLTPRADSPRPDEVYATETFSGSVQHAPVADLRPVNTALTDSVITNLLSILRDVLTLFIDAFRYQQTFGFRGAWRPATGNEFIGE